MFSESKSMSSSGMTGVFLSELMNKGKNEKPISFYFKEVASMVKNDKWSKDVGYIGTPRHSSLQLNIWFWY